MPYFPLRTFVFLVITSIVGFLFVVGNKQVLLAFEARVLYSIKNIKDW
jgi:hypothetical protein